MTVYSQIFVFRSCNILQKPKKIANFTPVHAVQGPTGLDLLVTALRAALEGVLLLQEVQIHQRSQIVVLASE